MVGTIIYRQMKNIIMEKIEKYKYILRDFIYLPKPDINPTFMEICHMGGDRFEERCSQILRFYFSPLAPHKLRGLFLDSLLELLGMKERYTIQNVKVYTEESTEDRKRIDITIVTDDFVIAIENKIFADVYNPLEIYREHVKNKYSDKKNKQFVVLSVKRITALDKIEREGFCYVSYADLFRVIKEKIGKYVIGCDQTYLTFLFDFIRTIEKKYIYNNTEMKQFFLKNRETIDKLVEQYEAFKKEIINDQRECISRIEKLVKEKTNANWYIFDLVGLCCTLNDQTHKIGIECNFDDDVASSNPIGNYHICITVWKEQHFYPYELELKKEFGNNIEKIDGRIYQYISKISCPVNDEKLNENEIVDTLVETYIKLKEITNRIK